MNKVIYELEIKKSDNKLINLGNYKGNVLLIVNTASKCGFTPQYKGLEELHKNFNKKGFYVLGFPCNQFGNQEPGTNEEIQSFCELNYQTTFPVFAKIEVNGKKTHPLFKHLKNEAPGLAGTKTIKWNFTKFLVDKNGNVIKRFASATKPESIISEIEKLL